RLYRSIIIIASGPLYIYINETNKAYIHDRSFHVEGGKLIIGATHDERRKIISVFQYCRTVE
ncbi:MAG: hypothetical protein ACKPKO_48830, partial [Candidatus Fonsibacter sp.]